MKLLSVILAGILLVASVIFALVSAAPVSSRPAIISGLTGNVYLSFYAQGKSVGASAVMLARLQQNVHILEQAFLDLHRRGELNSPYGRLGLELGTSQELVATQPHMRPCFHLHLMSD